MGLPGGVGQWLQERPALLSPPRTCHTASLCGGAGTLAPTSIPPSISSFPTAACPVPVRLACQVTAYGFFDYLKVPKGGWLLSNAASSVLGRMVIQLGKHLVSSGSCSCHQREGRRPVHGLFAMVEGPAGAAPAGRGGWGPGTLQRPRALNALPGNSGDCTVLCYTCLYSEKETQGPARLRPGKKGGREGRSRC